MLERKGVKIQCKFPLFTGKKRDVLNLFVDKQITRWQGEEEQQSCAVWCMIRLGWEERKWAVHFILPFFYVRFSSSKGQKCLSKLFMTRLDGQRATIFYIIEKFLRLFFLFLEVIVNGEIDLGQSGLRDLQYQF